LSQANRNAVLSVVTAGWLHDTAAAAECCSVAFEVSAVCGVAEVVGLLLALK
jgi:hypothetical protein